MSDHVTVTCPHCGSTLDVDVHAGVVVRHAAPVVEGRKTDFDQRLRELEAEKCRAADRMAEALRAEQSKERLLEDRFRKLMEESKNDKDADKPHIRDIDLD